jgi:signal transduction histidine kinase/HPt (histidine-containing phosphotransfer) domain-containing protein
MTRRDQGQPPASAAPAASAEEPGRRVAAAAIGLSIAGVSAPIAVATLAATNAALWRPLAASTLVALLVLAPAGVGVATALAGLRRIAALAAEAGSEAEQAVLRVFVATLLFGYALGLAAASPLYGAAADCVAVAAPELVAAWALLLYVILWPVAPALRLYGAMMLDIALFSLFLHFGGSAVAGWYPLYLLAIFYAGSRFGLGALLASAIASIVGFAAVVLSTDSWRQQPMLAAGLILALAVLPGFVAAAIHALEAARAKAAVAEADRQRTLLLIADTLRGPTAAPRSTRAASSPISHILDFAAIEAGGFAPPFETFDLRALVRHSLVPLQAKAAENGVALRWRIDPRLPYRLRGHAQVFARILAGLADHAVDVAPAASVRITLDASAGDAGARDASARDQRRVRLRLRVDGLGLCQIAGLAPDEVPLALRLVQRLAAMAGGEFAVDRLAGQRTRLTVTLSLAVEEGAPGPVLDLARRPVLIATEDDELARDLAEPLAVWNADPRWLSDTDAALAELARPGETQRPVVIVDGRNKLLSALSLAHQAARLGAAAPFVVLIAEEAQIASLGEVDEGGLDGFIPVPVTELLLANALYALPLDEERPKPRLDAAPRPPERQMAPKRQPATRDARQHDADRVTPIAAHPRFMPEAAAAVDAQVIERLRALGGGPGFLRELIETFQADARQVMESIGQAAAAADAAGFARSLGALRRAAGHLGGTQLGELLASLQGLTASELRQRGAIHVQRLDAEIDRLAAALLESLPASEARRT